MCMLIELYFSIAPSVSHSGYIACQTWICLTSRTAGISLAVEINNRPNWNLLLVHVYVSIYIMIVSVCLHE